MRQNYGVARAASVELAQGICTNLRAVPTCSLEGEPNSLTLAEWRRTMDQNREARELLIRYLNFAHLARQNDPFGAPSPTLPSSLICPPNVVSYCITKCMHAMSSLPCKNACLDACRSSC